MKKEILIVSTTILAAAIILAALAMTHAESVDVIFITGANQMYCENTSTSAFWVNSSNSAQRFVVNSTSGNCSLYSAVSLNSYCCPTNYLCNSSSGRCYSTEGYTYCSEIQDRTTCLSIANDSRIPENSATAGSDCDYEVQYNSGSYSCINYTVCSCYWDAADSVDPCKGATTPAWSCNSDNDGDGNPDHGTYGTCLSSVTVVDNCGKTLNNIIATTITQWSGSANPLDALRIACVNANLTTRSLPCVSTARLDFTTNFGLALIIALIIAGYLLIEFRKRC